MRNTIVIILIAFMASSCYNDSRENLNPQLPTSDNTSLCDSTNVTYIKDIKPILSSSCSGCHYSSSSYPLISFADVKSRNEKIITTISDGSMPKDADPLSICKINKFKAWKNQGYK